MKRNHGITEMKTVSVNSANIPLIITTDFRMSPRPGKQSKHSIYLLLKPNKSFQGIHHLKNVIVALE